MSESQKPQANTPSTHESGTASPFAAAAAQGEQPGQAPGGEMSDVSYSMETVTVDPSTLNMLRGSGQSQAPSQQASAQPQASAQQSQQAPAQPQQAPGQPQAVPGQAPVAGPGAGAVPASGAPGAGGQTTSAASGEDWASHSPEGSAATVVLPSGGFRTSAADPAAPGRPLRRDRFTSAPRSVHFRVEIGSVARNRFRQGGAERLCPSGPRSNAVPRRRRGFHGR